MGRGQACLYVVALLAAVHAQTVQWTTHSDDACQTDPLSTQTFAATGACLRTVDQIRFYLASCSNSSASVVIHEDNNCSQVDETNTIDLVDSQSCQFVNGTYRLTECVGPPARDWEVGFFCEIKDISVSSFEEIQTPYKNAWAEVLSTPATTFPSTSVLLGSTESTSSGVQVLTLLRVAQVDSNETQSDVEIFFADGSFEAALQSAASQYLVVELKGVVTASVANFDPVDPSATEEVPDDDIAGYSLIGAVFLLLLCLFFIVGCIALVIYKM